MQPDAIGFALIYLLVPAALILLTHRSDIAARLGPIVLCYMAGLLLGLSGLQPASLQPVRDTIIEVSLGLALPLLLFAVDLRSWGHIAGSAILSMALAIVAVAVVATALYFLFHAGGTDQAEQLSGMAVGMYTGGLANMGAIKLALDIPEGRYLLFATVDTVVGAGYLLFVLTLAPVVMGRFLSPFTGSLEDQAEESNKAAPSKQNWVIQGLIAVTGSALCVGASLVLAPILPIAEPQIMVVVLLTTFGILGSLTPSLHRNVAAPHMGMYLLYVFSFSVAASMDLAQLQAVDLSVLFFVLIATFGSFALHAVLARLAGIDRDTFLITSVAAVMSPAFVPMVSRSLRNPAILMSGMATGILGFAIGNYLGISLALLLAGKG
ncbi:DUF819 family protein [Rhodobacteraceae bacterium B1Z28]|uniref:DUF819 family protein n=1 Tax=Ruegeria haliotis TaxID=2747601 RepID=A0ABX2PQ62_9RHOB|nr:DUF819 family protein [Ruegeria haliotis]NVO56262.1 DUF819 family protein [Ruegeria haliotis]